MKSFRSKPVGWRGESHRHYLAAKGIKTRYDASKMDTWLLGKPMVRRDVDFTGISQEEADEIMELRKNEWLQMSSKQQVQIAERSSNIDDQEYARKTKAWFEGLKKDE